eukprot:g17703.t1
MSVLLLRLLFLLAANVHFTSALDDGLARTPPMGWRSWNAFHEKIDQNLLSTVIDKVSEHLAPLGFTDVGIDDNWQKCSENATTGREGFHDPETGAPIVDEKRFWELDPATQQRVGSMRPIVETAHAQNLTIGWYLNNCMCAETDLPPETARRNLQGDVKALFDYGFDGVKLDGCGQNTDLAAWVAEIQARTGNARTGKITIENCHWGGDLQISAGGAGSGAQMGRAEKRDEVLATSSAPSSDGNSPSRTASSTTCPYHFARTSFDIGPSWRGVYLNLQTLSRSPAGRPHCWNYPDMLEVGNHREREPLRFDQAHFSMWAATSSPLILSFDVRKLGGSESSYHNELLGRVLSNEAVISVNQVYANDAGRLVFSWEPTPNAAFPWSLPCDPFDGVEQSGWFLANGTEPRWRSAEAEFCLDSQTGTDPVLVTLVPCASLAPGGERRFRYDADTGALVRSRDVGSSSNTTEECVKQFEAGFELTTDRTHCRSFFLSEQGKLFQRTSTTEPSMLDHRCVGVKTSAPLSANTLQLWTKKLPVPTPMDHRPASSSMIAEELDPSRGSVDAKRHAARLDELLAAASRKGRKAEMRLSLSSKKPDVVEQTIVARQAVLLLNADATAEHPFNFSPGVLERLFGPSDSGTRFVIYDLWARDLSPASVGADDYVVNIPSRGCRFFVFQKIKDGSAEESRPTAVDIYA